MRQGGSGRKGVAFQEEEEFTTTTDGSRKDKQQCDGTLKRKDTRYDKRISRTFSRIAVRCKKYQVRQRKFKENNCFGKRILRKLSKIAENVTETVLRKTRMHV